MADQRLQIGALRMLAQFTEQALALDEALTELEKLDERAARIVELRWFAGMAPERIAEMFGLTRRTVDRDWRFARAFLYSALG